MDYSFEHMLLSAYAKLDAVQSESHKLVGKLAEAGNHLQGARVSHQVAEAKRYSPSIGPAMAVSATLAAQNLAEKERLWLASVLRARAAQPALQKAIGELQVILEMADNLYGNGQAAVPEISLLLSGARDLLARAFVTAHRLAASRSASQRARGDEIVANRVVQDADWIASRPSLNSFGFETAQSALLITCLAALAEKDNARVSIWPEDQISCEAANAVMELFRNTGKWWVSPIICQKNVGLPDLILEFGRKTVQP